LGGAAAAAPFLLFLEEDEAEREGAALVDWKSPPFLQTAQKGWGTLKHWWLNVYNLVELWS
jgi:hypothetical protein